MILSQFFGFGRGSVSMFKGQDRRRNFRVSLIHPILGFLQLDNFEKNINNLLLISILDIGAGGMKIKSPYFFPVNKNVLFHVYFSFDWAEFGFESRLIWRKAEKEASFYGFEFIKKTQSFERKLIESLNKYREKNGYL